MHLFLRGTSPLCLRQDGQFFLIFEISDKSFFELLPKIIMQHNYEYLGGSFILLKTTAKHNSSGFPLKLCQLHSLPDILIDIQSTTSTVSSLIARSVSELVG